MTKRNPEHFAREKALYMYSSALAEGDFDTVLSVLKLAEQDALLDQMIQELNQAYDEEQEGSLQDDQDEVLVQQLLLQHLVDGRSESADDVPEVTVGEVVARLQADRTIPSSDQAASLSLQGSTLHVPRSPSRRSIKELATRIGASLSERFWLVFRETAIMLGLRASQQVHYAAARKQRSQSGKPTRKDRDGGADA